MWSQKGLRKTVTRGLPEHRILFRWKAVSLCRVGNHAFLHVCRAVEIDFCLELLYVTIVCLIKPENSLAPGTEREGHNETVVLQGYPPATPRAHQPLDFSCPVVLGNEKKSMRQRADTPTLASLIWLSLEINFTPWRKRASALLRGTCSPYPLPPREQRFLVDKADGSLLWKNI